MRMREYGAHADYAHMREYADADENLIHMNQIQIFAHPMHLRGYRAFFILSLILCIVSLPTAPL